MKMKRNLAILVAVAFLTSLWLPLSIAAVAGTAPRFIDRQGLLSAEQAAALTARLDEISQRHHFDTVVAVVPALDHREAHLFAADFFEQNGFGYGQDLDGAILLLATENRDFGFAALGSGIYAFSPAGQAYLDRLFLPDLKANRYFEAFMAYADGVDDFLAKAEAGQPYIAGNIPLTAAQRASYRLYAIIISLVLALAAALIVTGVWRGKLRSVRRDNLAHAYIRENSMVLTGQHDIFLYRQVHRVRRAEQNHSSSGGDSFTSSSGHSATGHSGKY
ncbi:MAG: TPM domain-containing protein [Oscillospiraceae bacterium]|jgi:uncharacterized protein|nr:TPM domain-containing protein [Oscillospiraceae bacterium]